MHNGLTRLDILKTSLRSRLPPTWQPESCAEFVDKVHAAVMGAWSMYNPMGAAASGAAAAAGGPAAPMVPQPAALPGMVPQPVAGPPGMVPQQPVPGPTMVPQQPPHGGGF